MKKVLLTTEAVHFDVLDDKSEGERYSTQSVGDMQQLGEELHITYESGNLEGEDVSVQTLIIGPDYVKTSRPGMGDAFMHFVAGKVTEYVSHTMYGDMYIDVDTKELQIHRKEEILVDMCYQLGAAGEVFTNCRMQIIIKILSE